jgi:hypothetical protein
MGEGVDPVERLESFRWHRVDGSEARPDPTPTKKETAMMKPTDMTQTTDEVIDRFNRAFQERDSTLRKDVA